jgi:hypothetical protein
MRSLQRKLVPLVALLVTATLAPPAYGAVSVSRAEVSGTRLRVEGTAAANRNITVDGVVMGTSSSSGRFRISRSGYTSPADCTIDVNDGSATARVATLDGCTVTQPEPEPEPTPTPVARLTPDVDQIGPGFVGSDFTDFSTTTTTITFGPDTLGPVRFEIIAGQLPAGLQLVDPNAGFTPAKSIHASVDGIPTTVQTSTFTIQATDANGLTATRTYSIVINPSRTLDIVPQAWGQPAVGEFSNLWIDGVGGVRPYTWARSAGAFPPGMSLVQDNPDGPLVRITGTPTTAGTFTFTIRLTDAQATSVSRTFTVTIPEPDTSTGPNAPTLLAPADGASVTTPVTIDWTEEFDPTLSANGGYNWQVSTSSTFSTLVLRDSTLPNVTQDTVSGIPNGTYFWRVQAVDGQLRSSTFSAPSTFTVTGATADQPGTPVLSLPPYGDTFHPFENFELFWTAAERAAKYELLASKDSTFPAGSIKFDNITDTRRGITIGDFCDGCSQGTYFARVIAIDANGNRGLPSNTVTFTISFDAPLPPPPTAVSPVGGATVSLPVTLDWTDVPNPQDLGYDIQVSSSSSFADIEAQARTTASQATILSLTPGTKFWRVHSVQGNSGPDTAAVTDWSTPASFTVPGGTVGVSSVWLGAPPCQDPCPGADTLDSGQEIAGSIQLTGAAPAGGAEVALTVSPAAGASVPASVTVPAGAAFANFRLFAGQVTEPTQVTLTATLGSSSDTFLFTVSPDDQAPAAPTLSTLTLAPSAVVGGDPSTGTVSISPAAPTGGAVVSLSSSDPAAATVPSSVTVPAGSSIATFTVTTHAVTTSTSVQITGAHGGVSRAATLTVSPPSAPGPAVSGLTLSPGTVTSGASSTGTVSLTAPAPAGGASVTLTTSNAGVATVQAAVTVPAGQTSTTFPVTSQPVTTTSTSSIAATFGGATRSAVLTVNPATQATDSVSVQRAEYDGESLRVEASSTSSTVTLRVLVTSSGALIGTLSNDGGGRYRGELSWPSNPQNITVTSSGGGSASRAVTAK